MKRGIVVAPQPEAVEVGARTYMAGGNAVDAAIATAFAQGVVDGLMCGVAGLGSCHIYAPKQGRHEVVDFYCRAPLAAKADMWTHLIEYQTRDGFSFVLKNRVNDVGYGAIATPGAVAGFHAVHTRYGRLKWEELLAPAVKLAEDGYTITPFVHTYWNSREGLGRADPIDRMELCKAAAPLFFGPDGHFHPIGTRVKNPAYGRTLRRLAAEGPETFYRGALAKEMVADLSAHGGLLTLDDLERYRVVEGPPIKVAYRGYEVAVNPPPGGGLMLAKMLNILENFDLAGMGHNTPAYIRTVAEAMKRAMLMKEKHLGDPEMVPVPVAEIVDRNRARAEADEIRRGKKASLVRQGLKEAADTTHLAAMDVDGLTLTMTHTLGYQSGVITDGLGFMYNGAMGFFDPAAGPSELDRAGKEPGIDRLPDHRLQGREAGPGAGCAGRRADPDGRAAGRPQRDRPRHERRRGDRRAALLGHQRCDRPLLSHPGLCRRGAGGRRLQGGSPALQLCLRPCASGARRRRQGHRRGRSLCGWNGPLRLNL